jgi:hypothetical protein
MGPATPDFHISKFNATTDLTGKLEEHLRTVMKCCENVTADRLRQDGGAPTESMVYSRSQGAKVG